MRSSSPRHRRAARTVALGLVALGLLISSLPLPAGPARAIGPPPSPGPASFPLSADASPDRLATASAPDLGAPAWINLTGVPTARPLPLGYGRSVVYDPVDNLTVAFGGCLASECPSNQTWVYAHGSWFNDTIPSDAPPARQSAAMDFDANMQGVLMFGGEGGNSTLFNDTWLFRAGTWTNLSFVGGGPAPRFGASLAFDPQKEENGSVLFGGCVPAFLGVSCFNDTWVWEGWSGWVPLSPSLLPMGVESAAMAYDPVDGYIVMFGGCTGFLCLGIPNVTYELYSGQWWQVDPANPPANRTGASMVYDPALRQLVLFGGVGTSLTALGDTWSFSGGAWHLLSSSSGPSPRSSFGLTLDPTGQVPLLVGGDTDVASQNDTWVFEIAPTAALGPAAAASETSQPVTFTATVAGGTPPYSATFFFGDGAGVLVGGAGPTLTATHAYDFPGSYGASVNVSDAVGLVVSVSGPTVTVTAGPVLSASATPSAADVGTSFSFGAGITSGTAPFGYNWSFGDGAHGGSATETHAYASAGTYLVNVTAVDAHGGSASRSVTVVVAPLPTIALASTPSTLLSGTAAAFYANVTGGTAPFVYAWVFGDGNTSASASPVHSYAKAGTYTVTARINDSGGGSTEASITVTVGAPSSPPAGAAASSTPTWFWAAIAGIIAVGGVGTVLLVLRSRKGPPAP
ncbi:MAG TPA: PKD domain-containing protein [Thermoplasmata archaeon]|nr:PKD domain-containing protein [Thermoplasmata archaeon]